MSMRISGEEILEALQDRYHRQRLISWWDQERLARSRVLVVGAGALGNEIIKLLALMGIGNILLIDMDRIERSNLSRGVLFRDDDVGQLKADCVARRAMELNPDIKVHSLGHNVMLQAGLGLFGWADVVIGAVDNREARVFINSACAAFGKPWVDGGIQDVSSVIRVFDPSSGPCYECTMNDTDRRLLSERQSCARLAREVMASGHTPSTSIAASIAGAFQVLEALKLLHGIPASLGQGLHVDGLSQEFSRVAYLRRDDCMGHERIPNPVPLGLGVDDVTFNELLERAEERVGPGPILDLSRDIILSLSCSECGHLEPGRHVVGALSEEDAACPRCGAHRVLDYTASVSRDLARDVELDLDTTPGGHGLPRFDVVVVRNGADQRIAWLFDGDAESVLGPLAGTMPPQNQREGAS